jgi:pyridoxamine 5'-phosphate oxidase
VTLEELAAIRAANEAIGLAEAGAPADPYELFARWHADVVDAGLPEPHAMAVATAGRDGRPRARNVLLRGLDGRGFVWFTNFDSVKGVQLEANPVASLLFSWFAIGRQVIVTGSVARVSDEESDLYWATRPVGSQLAALASNQSQVIPDRQWLDDRYGALEERYGTGPVPRPARWGGYRLDPDEFEFWHGRTFRMHDRLRYRREGDGDGDGWRIERLAP